MYCKIYKDVLFGLGLAVYPIHKYLVIQSRVLTFAYQCLLVSQSKNSALALKI